MKKILGVLCVLAIIINIYFGVYVEDSNEEIKPFDGPGTDDIVIPKNFTVTFPEKKLGDVAQYEYTLFAEMYWENKSSGEWQKYTLNAIGQLIDEILPEVIQSKDGFSVSHSTVCLQEVTSASFDIIVDGSDSDKATAHGDLNIQRNEYTDLNDKYDKLVIQTTTNADVSVDPLPNIPIPIEFNGYMRNYPNPNLEQPETLDEEIYMKNNELKVDDADSILKSLESDNWGTEFLTQRYEWTVEKSERIAGYSTLKINITTGFFGGWLDFTRQVWIANEVSFPVKVYTRTNSSWGDKDDDEYGYIELQHSRTLRDAESSFIRGENQVPWESCQAGIDSSHHFHERHPKGEFTEWDNDGYLPKAGNNYDASSFDFNRDIAEEYAMEHSEGLDLFLKRYDDVVVNWGVYSAEKDLRDIQGKAGSYHWNLSFGYNPTRQERQAAYDDYDREDENPITPNWGYYVNLTRNVTKEPGIDRYSEEIKIINEDQKDWGDSPLDKSDIEDEILTLAGSEEIMKLDPDIVSEAYGPVSGEINFQDTYYMVGMGDVTAANMPGLEIIETITGITMPSSRYSWILQQGGIFQDGQLFNAAVDVENGQLLYVLKIDGTSLYGIFD